MFGLDFGLALSSWFKSRFWFITEGSLLIPLSPPNKQNCQPSRKGAETIPNQGSQALIIPQTCRRSFSVVSNPIFASKYFYCRMRFFKIYTICIFFTAPKSTCANHVCITIVHFAKLCEVFKLLFGKFRWIIVQVSHFFPGDSHNFYRKCRKFHVIAGCQ